ncbi:MULTISPECIES: Ppx/GppA phosphatase family protein [unclassified Methanoregula]|uniref:Ppx/GppA phosphatase family protein n=1 Tax=unclassified Methanoregula TaxID=2649730 RepID=UPI0009C7BB17|nr:MULTISPECIES: Ppx/GppA phosphatase family protein [unclassified Methanoregula]OPX65030.1 MAG: exopolyphosphatase [Methanoregula sp. PtaB.Bin085]OPY32366.1 MAG: exopolyphosphatase [Methanoregula sp. PtaU1.Bin006]
MKRRKIGQSGRVVSFIDIGTNSVRLLVVRLNPNHSYSILTRQKQQVRLGEGEFEDDEIREEAIQRLVTVCRTFAGLSRTFSTEEFVAVATSAMREASNQTTILHLLRQEAQIDVRVISGQEEARLIYLGVASGFHLEERQAFFIDIGGGSTEIAVGNDRTYQYLNSFRLGAIRLSNLYLPRDDTGPVSPDQYRRLQHHIRDAIIHGVKKVRMLQPAMGIGSSGTITNLAEIAAKTRNADGGSDEEILSLKDLQKVIAMLCSLPLDQRKKVPGMNPERADIIIAGAAILEAFMKETGLDTITVTGRSLQDGLLIDYLSRIDDFPLLGELSPRERSVLQLGRSCGINEAHARTVTTLVLELFDSAKDLGLHDIGDNERELVEYATFLHDIGSFISYTNHHAHSYYIIKNSELLGFDEREITFMANIARFHRKRAPRKKDPEIMDLEPREREVLRILSTFVRLGESLDRSHTALIQHVRFSHADKETVHLDVIARGDCQLEIWGVEAEKKEFLKTFGRQLVIERVRAE